MAQNLAAKQAAIAAKMVTQATTLWDAVVALNGLQLEYLQAGAFTDANLGTGNTPQLTAFLVGLLLTTVVPALSSFMTTPLAGGTVPRDIFLQVRP